jgi:hypothetical protein
VSKRLSTLLVLVVGLLTVFAFTAGSGLAQTSTSTTGTSTVAPTVTRAATVASTAVATGTGGAVTTLPATGQTQGGSMNFLLIEALVIGLAVIATGIALKRRAPRT